MKRLGLLFATFLIAIIGCVQYRTNQKHDNDLNQLPVEIAFNQLEKIEEKTPLVYKNISIMIVETTEEDCTIGSRYFGQGEEGVWLFPSRMIMDVSKLDKISEITISGIDYCGSNCTKAFIYGNQDSLLNTTSNDKHGEFTFNFDSDLNKVKSIAISSCEGVVSTVKIK